MAPFKSRYFEPDTGCHQHNNIHLQVCSDKNKANLDLFSISARNGPIRRHSNTRHDNCSSQSVGELAMDRNGKFGVHNTTSTSKFKAGFEKPFQKSFGAVVSHHTSSSSLDSMRDQFVADFQLPLSLPMLIPFDCFVICRWARGTVSHAKLVLSALYTTKPNLILLWRALVLHSEMLYPSCRPNVHCVDKSQSSKIKETNWSGKICHKPNNTTNWTARITLRSARAILNDQTESIALWLQSGAVQHIQR